MKIFLFVLFLVVCACAPRQEPVQTVVNYTDNSQTIQVLGDNNELKPKTDITAQQTTKPQQTAENTTKNGMWIYWTIISVALVVGIYVFRKRLFK